MDSCWERHNLRNELQLDYGRQLGVLGGEYRIFVHGIPHTVAADMDSSG